jgi:tetratricopeptide (TPR) repeat protein
MDQFSAHLDRGWELIARNDPRGAEASARRALEIEPQSPEAYNLLGYCSALEGNAEEAIEAYRQAIALDDTYFEAMLNAAEVYIHPLRDFPEAIHMCDQALELAETDEETVDALLLKFDAILGQKEGDPEEARGLLDRMPPPPYENPAHTFLVGRAYFEVGDLEKASPLVELAAERDPQNAEAWYYLGLLRDERGDARAATEAFLKARELDLALPPAPWAPSREDFAAAARRVIDQLDAVLGGYVRRADIFVTDVPGVELVADGVDPRAQILFDGVSPPEQPSMPCARIFFYQRNIERLAGSAELLEEEIRAALEREITHYFLESDADSRSKNELNLARKLLSNRCAAAPRVAALRRTSTDSRQRAWLGPGETLTYAYRANGRVFRADP